MPTKEAKQVVIDMLTDRLLQSSAAIVTDYRGLTVAELAQLRGPFRTAQIDYRVAKNTLARRAAAAAGVAGAESLLKGPTAIAFCLGDFRTGARAVNDFARTSRKPFDVRGAIVGTRVVDAAAVLALPGIPPREQLYAQVVGGIQAPVARLVFVLSATLGGLVSVLHQRAEQMGSAAPGEAPAEA